MRAMPHPSFSVPHARTRVVVNTGLASCALFSFLRDFLLRLQQVPAVRRTCATGSCRIQDGSASCVLTAACVVLLSTSKALLLILVQSNDAIQDARTLSHVVLALCAHSQACLQMQTPRHVVNPACSSQTRWQMMQLSFFGITTR